MHLVGRAGMNHEVGGGLQHLVLADVVALVVEVFLAVHLAEQPEAHDEPERLVHL